MTSRLSRSSNFKPTPAPAQLVPPIVIHYAARPAGPEDLARPRDARPFGKLSIYKLYESVPERIAIQALFFAHGDGLVMHKTAHLPDLHLKDLTGRAFPPAVAELVRDFLNRVRLSIPVQSNGNASGRKIWNREDLAWAKKRLAVPNHAMDVHLAVRCEIVRSGQPKRVTGYQAVQAQVIYAPPAREHPSAKDVRPNYLSSSPMSSRPGSSMGEPIVSRSRSASARR